MFIHVKVRTRKPETKIVSQEGTTLIIEVKAPPEKGKANQELLKFLKRHFKYSVRIIRGSTSTEKIVEVQEGYARKP